jgi:hypothetical protein
MTIYKNIDQLIIDSCAKYKQGVISIGAFMDILSASTGQIISLEDKEERYFLQRAEAELDGNIAIYYGVENIDNLGNMYITQDKLLKQITINVVNRIERRFSDSDGANKPVTSKVF